MSVNCALFRKYVAEGSQEAISQFFQNQTDIFYRVALRYTRNEADAEDILQTAFLKILDHAHQYKGIDSDEEKQLQAWCLTIVVNSAFKKMKAEKVRRKNETSYVATKPQEFFEEQTMEATENEKAKLHRKIQTAIQQLPEKYRIPLHLKYVEGFEYDAIEKIMQLNSNTLRSLIKRGIERLSEHLKEQKVMLSGTALVLSIQQMPLESAPVHVKAMAAKVTSNIVRNSRRVRAHHASASTTFSPILVSMIIAGGVLATVLGVKLLQPQPPTTTTNSARVPTVIQKENTIPAATPSLEQKHTWMTNGEVSNGLTLMQGAWTYNSKNQSLEPEYNKIIAFQIPVKPQVKPLLIEMDAFFFSASSKVSTPLALHGYWGNDNSLLRSEIYPIGVEKNRHKFDVREQNQACKLKVYLYEGWIACFVQDKLFKLSKLSSDEISGSHLTIVMKNLSCKNIYMKTIEKIPEETESNIRKILTSKTPMKNPRFIISSTIFVTEDD